jgi:hypothetical protein
MTVVQIGDVTVGKNVGSVTLYDSLLLVRKIEIQIIVCNATHRFKDCKIQ